MTPPTPSQMRRASAHQFQQGNKLPESLQAMGALRRASAHQMNQMSTAAADPTSTVEKRLAGLPDSIKELKRTSAARKFNIGVLTTPKIVKKLLTTSDKVKSSIKNPLMDDDDAAPKTPKIGALPLVSQMNDMIGECMNLKDDDEDSEDERHRETMQMLNRKHTLGGMGGGARDGVCATPRRRQRSASVGARPEGLQQGMKQFKQNNHLPLSKDRGSRSRRNTELGAGSHHKSLSRGSLHRGSAHQSSNNRSPMRSPNTPGRGNRPSLHRRSSIRDRRLRRGSRLSSRNLYTNVDLDGDDVSVRSDDSGFANDDLDLCDEISIDTRQEDEQPARKPKMPLRRTLTGTPMTPGRDRLSKRPSFRGSNPKSRSNDHSAFCTPRRPSMNRSLNVSSAHAKQKGLDSLNLDDDDDLSIDDTVKVEEGRNNKRQSLARGASKRLTMTPGRGARPALKIPRTKSMSKPGSDHLPKTPTKKRLPPKSKSYGGPNTPKKALMMHMKEHMKEMEQAEREEETAKKKALMETPKKSNKSSDGKMKTPRRSKSSNSLADHLEENNKSSLAKKMEMMKKEFNKEPDPMLVTPKKSNSSSKRAPPRRSKSSDGDSLVKGTGSVRGHSEDNMDGDEPDPIISFSPAAGSPAAAKQDKPPPVKCITFESPKPQKECLPPKSILGLECPKVESKDDDELRKRLEIFEDMEKVEAVKKEEKKAAPKTPSNKKSKLRRTKSFDDTAMMKPANLENPKEDSKKEKSSKEKRIEEIKKKRRSTHVASAQEKKTPSSQDSPRSSRVHRSSTSKSKSPSKSSKLSRSRSGSPSKSKSSFRSKEEKPSSRQDKKEDSSSSSRSKAKAERTSSSSSKSYKTKKDDKVEETTTTESPNLRAEPDHSYRRAPKETWQCSCGYGGSPKEHAFCGVCGKAQFWGCGDCGFEKNLCVFAFCSACGSNNNKNGA